MSGHENDTVFIAGSFNNWSANYTPMTFSPSDKMWHITLKGISGDQQFKFTRGSWNSVQTTITGTDVGNYDILLKSDTTVMFSIASWRDHFYSAGKSHTASPQVNKLKKVFHIAALDTDKEIWVYVPPGYKKRGIEVSRDLYAGWAKSFR